MRLRPFVCVALVAAFPVCATAQTVYTWNTTTTGWTTPTAWTPAGVPGGNVGDTAQFTAPISGTVNNPVLNSSQSFFQLNFGSSGASGWSLTGTGALTLSGNTGTANAGSLSQAGLVTRAGSGTTSLNLGNGTTTSLTLSGATGAAGGSLNVGSSSTLVLTGNTVAVTSGSGPISIRGGTLVLDNSAGNPTGQRLTTANAINLDGGGSTLELRSAAGGTIFTGMTGALTTGSGGTTLRVNQTSAGGQLSVTFGSLLRPNANAAINFQNVGQGTLGGAGATDPRVLFNTAPTLANGVIGNTATTPGFALYNGTDFAGYDATRGVIAVASTDASGTLATGSTVNLNLTGSASGTGSIAYNTLKISPSASGQSLTLATTADRISTSGLLLAGTTDFSINGGGQWLTGNGARFAWITNANTALNMSVTLGAQEMNKLGDGFLILTGTTYQGPQTTANVNSVQNVNLGGGIMRVSSTNFDLSVTNAATLRFRGGVIEYDVSSGNYIFNRSFGTGAGNVNWTTAGGFAAATNAGSGGFSAYAGAGNGNGNVLTVNLNGGSTLYWNDQATTGAQLFVTDGYALKFGSLRSNATVNFANNIALDGSSGNELGNATNTVSFNRTREINVTRGVGNASDRTMISGVISGTANSDLVKTGTGVLELAGLNSYQGSTVVQGGELRITGQIGNTSPTGNVIVGTGATLSGTGIISQAAGNSTTVLNGGTIRGDSGTGTGNLTTGSVTVQSGGRLGVQLGTGTTASSLSTTAGVLNLNAGAVIAPNGTFDSSGSRVLANLASGSGALIVGGTTYNTDATIATYTQNGGTGLQSFGALQLDLSGINLNNGEQLVLSRSGNNLVLVFTPVPEPASLLAVCGLVVGGVVAVRRLRRKGTPADVTPAAWSPPPVHSSR